MRFETILLFGAPGSGKGTQGKTLGARGAFFHSACGDVFRALDPQSEMGKVFAGFGKTGALVPDDLTVELWRQTVDGWVVAKRFDPQRQMLLLDGIPRTVEQAQLMQDRIDVVAIIHLVCNDIAEIISRLQHRAAKDNRADDTNEEVIRHRLDVYEEQTRPVLEFYPRQKIFRVDATKEQELVTANILQALELLRHRSWSR